MGAEELWEEALVDDGGDGDVLVDGLGVYSEALGEVSEVSGDAVYEEVAHADVPDGLWGVVVAEEDGCELLWRLALEKVDHCGREQRGEYRKLRHVLNGGGVRIVAEVLLHVDALEEAERCEHVGAAVDDSKVEHACEVGLGDGCRVVLHEEVEEESRLLDDDVVEGEEHLRDEGEEERGGELALGARDGADDAAVCVADGVQLAEAGEHVEEHRGELDVAHDGVSCAHEGPAELYDVVEGAPLLHALRPAEGGRRDNTIGKELAELVHVLGPEALLLCGELCAVGEGLCGGDDGVVPLALCACCACCDEVGLDGADDVVDVKVEEGHEVDEEGDAAVVDEELCVGLLCEEDVEELEEAVAGDAVCALAEEGDEVRDVAEGPYVLVVVLVDDGHGLDAERLQLALALEQRPVEQHVEELWGVAQHRRLLAGLGVEEEAEVVAPDVDLAAEAVVGHDELAVVPRDVPVGGELLLLAEDAELALEGLAELLAGVVVPDEVCAEVVLLDLVEEHGPVLVAPVPLDLALAELCGGAFGEAGLAPRGPHAHDRVLLLLHGDGDPAAACCGCCCGCGCCGLLCGALLCSGDIWGVLLALEVVDEGWG